jgi:hypothetical protein
LATDISEVHRTLLKSKKGFCEKSGNVSTDGKTGVHIEKGFRVKRPRTHHIFMILKEELKKNHGQVAVHFLTQIYQNRPLPL